MLYKTVAEHFETWLELSSAGQFDGQGDHHTPAPYYVEKACRKYLECGIFAHLSAGGAATPEPPAKPKPRPSAAYLWATLIARIYEVFPLLPTEVLLIGDQHGAPQHQQIEQQVKSALKWHDKGGHWEAYEPAVMTAVRAATRPGA